MSGRDQSSAAAHCGVTVHGGAAWFLEARRDAGVWRCAREWSASSGGAVHPASAIVVLPHGKVHSQRIELDASSVRDLKEVARSVASREFDSVETVHDAQSLAHGSAAWVSLARASDAETALAASGIPPERIDRMVAMDAALATAFRQLVGRLGPAVLLDLGPDLSQILVLRDGEPVFSADVEPGGNALLAALAADLDGTIAAARERLSRTGSLPLSVPRRFETALARLVQMLDGVLRDHAREAGLDAAELLEAGVWMSGELPSLPGWERPAARAFGEARVRRWPALADGSGNPLEASARVARLGAAMIGLGLAGSPPNLAPVAARSVRRAWIRAARLQIAACILAAGALVAGLANLLSQASALHRQRAELAVLRDAAEQAPPLGAARESRARAYEAALPALYLQKRTRDFVEGLRLLQAHGTSGDHWFALVADVETYGAGTLPQGTPRSAPEPQDLHGSLGRQSGLIVELGFRPGAEDPLGRVSGIIRDLRAGGHFRDVDLLPARARQALADRSVFAADGSDFALRMEAFPFEHALDAPQPAPLLLPAPR